MSNTQETTSTTAGNGNGQGQGANGKPAEENAFEVADARLAYERVLPKLEAIGASEIQRFKANVPRAVANTFQVVRCFAKERPLFEAVFAPGKLNLADLDDLPDRAMALWYSDIMLRQALDPDTGLKALVQQGRTLQRKLRNAALYLWRGNGNLSGILTDIRQGRSRLDSADDLAALANLFENRWTEADGRCDIARTDIDDAKNLSVRILEAANRSFGSSEALFWRGQRDRAGTYLYRGMKTVRLAATIVHQQNPEALKRYPGLFSGRKAHRRESEAVPASPKPEVPTTQTAA